MIAWLHNVEVDQLDRRAAWVLAMCAARAYWKKSLVRQELDPQ